ncbi:MAG: hypothetical protein QFB87_02610 [Patescibacteria group bacterium]|nr:hypothetical protein [Patescibacteria group bacterium]
MAKSVTAQPTWRYNRLFYSLLLLAALLQFYLTYRLAYLRPIANYSTTKLLLIRLSFLLPQVVIWWIAARSAKRFTNYAAGIKSSVDGQGMSLIGGGLVLLVAYIIILPLCSQLNSLAAHTTSIRVIAIITNHLPLVVVLAAAIQIYRGSSRLSALASHDTVPRRRKVLISGAFIVCMLSFAVDFYHQAPTLVTTEGVPRFFLNHNLLIFTYVLPHIAVWLMGLLASVNLAWYTTKIDGKIYRSLFRDVNRGLVLVFTSIFAAQLLMISPLIVMHLGVGIIFVYMAIILGLAGYALLYRGTGKLQNLEEVG